MNGGWVSVKDKCSISDVCVDVTSHYTFISYQASHIDNFLLFFFSICKTYQNSFHSQKYVDSTGQLGCGGLEHHRQMQDIILGPSWSNIQRAEPHLTWQEYVRIAWAWDTSGIDWSLFHTTWTPMAVISSHLWHLAIPHWITFKHIHIVARKFALVKCRCKVSQMGGNF